MANCWVLHCSPEVYDLLAWFENPEFEKRKRRMFWPVPQHTDKVQPGDMVFIRVGQGSKTQPGIYARATVMDVVCMKDPPELGGKHYIPPSDGSTDEPRALLRVDKYSKNRERPLLPAEDAKSQGWPVGQKGITVQPFGNDHVLGD